MYGSVFRVLPTVLAVILVTGCGPADEGSVGTSGNALQE